MNLKRSSRKSSRVVRLCPGNIDVMPFLLRNDRTVDASKEPSETFPVANNAGHHRD
jgi:hypothetical protein